MSDLLTDEQLAVIRECPEPNIVRVLLSHIDAQAERIAELKRMTSVPSSILCREYHIQNCHVCDDIKCGDNRSPAKQRIAELEAALREIAKGEGAFSRDQLTHAENCIDNMKSIAQEALQGKAGVSCDGEGG